MQFDRNLFFMFASYSLSLSSLRSYTAWPQVIHRVASGHTPHAMGHGPWAGFMWCTVTRKSVIDVRSLWYYGTTVLWYYGPMVLRYSLGTGIFILTTFDLDIR